MSLKFEKGNNFIFTAYKIWTVGRNISKWICTFILNVQFCSISSSKKKFCHTASKLYVTSK